jgi:REP element-mobilizing transposase RayT
MRGPPIHLTLDQAEAFVEQVLETIGVRKWELLAVAVMVDHFHMVVGAPDDVGPSKILGDVKSWGTRKLTEKFGEPLSETWWTERGSKRKLANARAIEYAVTYVLRQQPSPLVIWPKGPI